MLLLLLNWGLGKVFQKVVYAGGPQIYFWKIIILLGLSQRFDGGVFGWRYLRSGLNGLILGLGSEAGGGVFGGFLDCSGSILQGWTLLNSRCRIFSWSLLDGNSGVLDWCLLHCRCGGFVLRGGLGNSRLVLWCFYCFDDSLGSVGGSSWFLNCHSLILWFLLHNRLLGLIHSLWRLFLLGFHCLIGIGLWPWWSNSRHWNICLILG